MTEQQIKEVFKGLENSGRKFFFQVAQLSLLLCVEAILTSPKGRTPKMWSVGNGAFFRLSRWCFKEIFSTRNCTANYDLSCFCTHKPVASEILAFLRRGGGGGGGGFAEQQDEPPSLRRFRRHAAQVDAARVKLRERGDGLQRQRSRMEREVEAKRARLERTRRALQKVRRCAAKLYGMSTVVRHYYFSHLLLFSKSSPSLPPPLFCNTPPSLPDEKILPPTLL